MMTKNFSDDNTHQIFNFLWDKWKYHDQLMHSRNTIFWTIQVALIGAIAVISQKLTCVRLILSSLLSVIVAVTSYFITELINKDRRVRNVFNLRIIRFLIKSGVFKENKIYWTDWSPDNINHPSNLWHAPFLNPRKVIGSKWIQKQHTLMIGFDILLIPILVILYYFFN